ncbi:hypothetical protein [Rhizobium halophytocola]|uniref:Uncharacterized protein n=1 Tax=Rhizobium halophytocola TaxID=735519 RepID=A0ABS4DWA7_9HYPH|nr:hypothetical protein [Rhizobium halophytocola]MBP1849983.1 hypothetical protein [Rhizobium halophytocola]
MMTILGCDDGLNQCKYVDTARERYVSVELCDAASENILDGYGDINYPTVIAVCQKPGQQVAALPGGAVRPEDAPTPGAVKQDLSDLSDEGGENADGQVAALPPAGSGSTPPAAALPGAVPADDPHAHENLAARALETIKRALPGKERVRMVFTAPLHVITDSYSWVAKRVKH